MAPDFTPDQLSRLWELVRLVDPSASSVQYAILAIEDLADREASLRLVRELLGGEWEQASHHAAVAAPRTMLITFVLQTDPSQPRGYWALLRSPYDPWEDASLESHGRIPDVGQLPRTLHWNALPSGAGKVRGT